MVMKQWLALVALLLGLFVAGPAQVMAEDQVLRLATTTSTADVDSASAALIRSAALEARQNWGATVIIASHDLDWLLDSADEILHLFQSRLSGFGLPNLLSGPWQKDDQGRWFMNLPDGQSLFAPPRPKGAKALIISPDDLAVYLKPPEDKPGYNRLKAQPTRLSLEKPSGQVLASLTFSRLSLTVRLEPSQLKELAIRPGEEAWIAFEESAGRWA